MNESIILLEEPGKLPCCWIYKIATPTWRSFNITRSGALGMAQIVNRRRHNYAINSRNSQPRRCDAEIAYKLIQSDWGLSGRRKHRHKYTLSPRGGLQARAFSFFRKRTSTNWRDGIWQSPLACSGFSCLSHCICIELLIAWKRDLMFSRPWHLCLEV